MTAAMLKSTAHDRFAARSNMLLDYTNRIYLIAALVAVLVLLVCGRLFVLVQVSSHSKDTVVRDSEVISSRRDIVDRNGSILATNLMTGSLYANPKEIKNPRMVANKIHKIFPELDKKKLLSKLQSKKSFVWVKRNVTPAQQQKFLQLGLVGVYIERSEKRAYIHGRTTGHLLGFTSIDMQGRSGIERFFDEQLVGYGKPLALSVDIRVQNIVHEALGEAIKTFSAEGGTAVMIDVESGEIIAMVSFPDFDPHKVTQNSKAAMFNMATQGIYELGSIFKVFTTVAAFESGAVKLSDQFDATKAIKIGKFRIGDYRGKNRWLSVPEIFIYSSNIGAMKMLLEMGKDKLQETYHKLGLFEPLVGLEFGEIAQPSLTGQWSEARALTASYGYGVATTPLHFLRALAAVVNGGKLINPSFVKGNPGRIEQRVMSEKTSKTIRKLMYKAALQGTSRRARVNGYMVGGKTGSANKIIDGKYDKKKHLASVTTIFPMNKPKYAMLITLDAPQGTKETHGFSTGGWTAAPVAAKIIEQAGPILGVLPVDENDEVIQKAMYVKVEYDNEKRALG